MEQGPVGSLTEPIFFLKPGMDKKISLYKDAHGEENYRGQKKKLREDSGV